MTTVSTTGTTGDQSNTQEVLGVRENGASSPTSTMPASNQVLGANANGTTPAAGRPGKCDRAGLGSEPEHGSLPFTGTDAILVLLLGCALLLRGLTLQRRMGRAGD